MHPLKQLKKSITMKRKWFLFTPLCLAGFLFVFLFSCDKENESAIDNLYQQFQQADEKYSPGVWWWWNGNALTQKEIIRQLDTLKNAGIGEVSVVPMEIPEDVESLPQGFEKLKWMSPKWKKMLEFTIKQAEKRNIKVHISIGQGWPLGDILHKYPAARRKYRFYFPRMGLYSRTELLPSNYTLLQIRYRSRIQN